VKRQKDPFDSVLELWSWREISARPGVSTVDIRAFERHYLVSLPTELQRFFRKANGMQNVGEYKHDAHYVRFWNLPSEHDLLNSERSQCDVAPLPLAWPSAPERFEHLFVLGDWNNVSAVFCAQLNERPWGTAEIFLYDGYEPTRLAYSFHEFILRYLTLRGEAFTIRTNVIE
jgi:hypothetical protein